MKTVETIKVAEKIARTLKMIPRPEDRISVLNFVRDLTFNEVAYVGADRFLGNNDPGDEQATI